MKVNIFYGDLTDISVKVRSTGSNRYLVRNKITAGLAGHNHHHVAHLSMDVDAV